MNMKNVLRAFLLKGVCAMEFGRPSRRVLRTSLVALLVLWISGPLFAQQTQEPSPLTLQQAIDVALEKNPDRKAALAQGRAAAAVVRERKAGLLPQVTFSESATRGNDPVYVFGTLLRQNRFGASNFTLGALNKPSPVNDYVSRFDGSWTLFDSFATKHSFERAKDLRAAADQQLARSDQELVMAVVKAYYDVLLARKNLEVADQGVQTAQSILASSRDRVQSGVVVESELLSAQVNFAERQQQQIRVRNDEALALSQLDVAMGVQEDLVYEPVGGKPDTTSSRESLATLEQRALEHRPDLKQLRLESSAQDKTVSAAKSAFGPRLKAVSSWETDRVSFAGSGGNNWVAGVDLQFDIFDGGAKAARLARERAVADQISAARQSAQDQIRLQVRRAYYDADTAHRQVEVAKDATSQAQEDLRISQNRFEAGLTTITDLLRVEEEVRRVQTNYWQALYGMYDSLARLELATGTLNRNSTVVKP